MNILFTIIASNSYYNSDCVPILLGAQSVRWLEHCAAYHQAVGSNLTHACICEMSQV